MDHQRRSDLAPACRVGSGSFAFAVSPRLHALMVHVFAIKTSPISRARSVNRSRETTNAPGKSGRSQVIQRICSLLTATIRNILSRSEGRRLLESESGWLVPQW